MNNIVEAVRQIRGQSHNQVQDAQRVLITSGMAGAVLARA